jgi:hypothetical protein
MSDLCFLLMELGENKKRNMGVEGRNRKVLQDIQNLVINPADLGANANVTKRLTRCWFHNFTIEIKSLPHVVYLYNLPDFICFYCCCRAQLEALAQAATEKNKVHLLLLLSCLLCSIFKGCVSLIHCITKFVLMELFLLL